MRDPAQLLAGRFSNLSEYVLRVRNEFARVKIILLKNLLRDAEDGIFGEFRVRRMTCRQRPIYGFRDSDDVRENV